VVPTAGANIQVVRHFAVKQHRAAFATLSPKVVGRLASRENRVYPWPDVVGNPVDTFGPFWVCYNPDNLARR
jgi:hypothetical protein